MRNPLVCICIPCFNADKTIAETLGKGLEDEKYIESWNKTMKLLGIEMPLKDLEKIYNEFATKMDELVESENIKPKKSDKKL